MWVDAADGVAEAHLSTLSIETAHEGWESESKRGFVAGSESKNCRRGKSRQDQPRRIAAKFFLDVSRGQPVVVDAEAAAYGPIAMSRWVPRETCSRTEQPVN